MVVAGQRQHPAPGRSAGHVGVLEDVAAAVHAGALAVPDAEHAVIVGALEQVDLLRAPDRGGGKVFVDAWLEHDVVFLEVLLRLGQRLVVAAQGRAPVAGNEAGGVLAGGEVALALQHRQAHQRLRAGHEGRAAVVGVLVFERDGFEQLGVNRCIHGRCLCYGLEG